MSTSDGTHPLSSILYKDTKPQPRKRKFEFVFCIMSLVFWTWIALWFGSALGGTSVLGSNTNFVLILLTIVLSLVMIVLSFVQGALLFSEVSQIEIDGHTARIYFYHRSQRIVHIPMQARVFSSIKLFRCDAPVGFGVSAVIYCPPLTVITISHQVTGIDQLLERFISAKANKPPTRMF